MVTRIGPKRPVKIYLAEWRERAGLTQEQLAERIGTTKSSISRWENADRDLTLSVVAALAEALGIEPDQIYHHPDKPSADALLRDAEPAIQQQVFKVIEALKKTGS